MRPSVAARIPPPLSQERLGRLNQDQLVTPPRVHKHRYCGVLAPNAKLWRAVIESAGPAGATLQLLQEANAKMDLNEEAQTPDEPPGALGRAAARGWVLLLPRHPYSGIAQRFNSTRIPAWRKNANPAMGWSGSSG